MDGLFVRSRVHGSPVSDVFIPIDFVEVPSKSDPSIIHKVKRMLGDIYANIILNFHTEVTVSRETYMTCSNSIHTCVSLIHK